MAGPVLDLSTPAVATRGTGGNATTSPAFSPPADSIIVMEFASNSAPNNINTTITGVTNTGLPLTWAKLASDGVFVTSALTGCTEVWWAYNPTAQTGITVTATQNQNISDPSPGDMLQVKVYTNAKSDQSAAAHASTHNSTGALPSLAVTTTAANSLVNMVVANWSNPTVGTPAAGQSIYVSEVNTPASGSYWSQQLNAPVASGTVVTMADTAPSVHFHAVAYEILAKPGTNDFGITAGPSSISTPQGTPASTTIGTSIVSGSAESVALSIVGALPAGIAAAFTPGSVTAGGSSSLAFTVDPSTVPGVYPITVRGTAVSATHTVQVMVTVAAATPSSSSGLGIPFGYPHGYGTSAPSENDAVNLGNVATPPTITIHNPGKMTNPLVRNKNTGEEIRLALIRNGPPSDIVIDCDAGTVIEDGDSDIADTIDWTVSTFFWLDPGVTTIQLAGDSVTDVTATVQWSDAFIF